MLDGRPLVDVHLHPARKDSLNLPWAVWTQDFASSELDALYDGDAINPARFDAMLAAEGVDAAVVLAEYSPRVTGWQRVEDMRALADGAQRVHFAANVNPDLAAVMPKNDVVGTILDVEGQVSIVTSEGSAPAVVNGDVHPGDVIATGSGGRAFIQMIDNTELTLGENGQMTVDQYTYNDKGAADNGAVYTIIKGAFLFVDGLLGA